ncbi:MAG: hypothetical protein RBU37_06165 [Myxococcota bacterium]|nr:hypothetical protein [Myxococcota bacterium]
MPSVFAIIAKSAFAQLEKTQGPICPGMVVPLDHYLSRHKTFEALTGGGLLYLVTVRPPDEQLWLVAVLVNPTFDGEQWVAQPNAAPVRDVSALVPALRFNTGKGVSAKPGALAMSLQTPRLLTDADVALLDSAAAPSDRAPSAAETSPTPPPFAQASSESASETYYQLVKQMHGGRKASKASVIQAIDIDVPVPQGPAALGNALVSLPRWQSLDDGSRATVLQQLLATLGNDYTLGSLRSPTAGLATIVHVPTGVELVLVPGGYLTMGTGIDDAFAIYRMLDREDQEEMKGAFAQTRPVHVVRVKPFLLASRSVDPAVAIKASGKRAQAEVFEALGFRLPSEAEWEWVAREGGAVRFTSSRGDSSHAMKMDLDFARNGWGIENLLNAPELVADGWHPNYDGAPDCSMAWEPTAGPNVARMGHTYFQSSFEVSALHAAYRLHADGGQTRFARDVPGCDYPCSRRGPRRDHGQRAASPRRQRQEAAPSRLRRARRARACRLLPLRGHAPERWPPRSAAAAREPRGRVGAAPAPRPRLCWWSQCLDLSPARTGAIQTAAQRARRIRGAERPASALPRPRRREGARSRWLPRGAAPRRAGQARKRFRRRAEGRGRRHLAPRHGPRGRGRQAGARGVERQEAPPSGRSSAEPGVARGPRRPIRRARARARTGHFLAGARRGPHALVRR